MALESMAPAVPALLEALVLETGLSLEPPFEEPVLIFGLAMVAFFTAPLILERFRLPGIIGIILVGAAVGPEGIGILPDNEGIALLGEAGLIFLMFIAGLEINFNQFLEYKDRSAVFGLFSFVIPQVLGTVVGMALLDLTLAAALLFGAIFSSHTLLAYPIVSRLGIAKDEAMTATIGGTVITDTLALLVLAVVIASLGGETGVAFWGQFALGLVAFFVGVWLIVPKVGRWFFRYHQEESYYEFLFVMAILFIAAILAEMAGVKHIVGAFLAGLALNRLIPESGPLMNRLEFVGNALLIPFFLLWVGTLVDLRALFAGVDTLVIAGSLVVMVVATKLAASWATGRIYEYSRDQVLGMFGLSVGQAAAALAIVLIGFDEGVPGFDQDMINGVVLMILLVSILSPALVGRAGQAMRRAAEDAEYDPTESPQRILVPFSRNSEYREELLDLALVVRDDRSEEPIYTLSVVPPGEDIETEAEVADIEEMMEEMEEYAAGAEVPIDDETRVQRNVSSGIVSAVVENRISTLIIGWDGARSRRQNVFGHIIDQVLNRTSQLTLVGRVRKPLNTVERVVIVIPPGMVHNDGFAEAVHTIKGIAADTGATVRCLVIAGTADHVERLFERIEPEVPGEYEALEDWDDALAVIRDDVENGDLVVVMSARRGEFGWDGKLQTMPKSVSTLTDGNFIVVYPAKAERTDDRRFFRW